MQPMRNPDHDTLPRSPEALPPDVAWELRLLDERIGDMANMSGMAAAQAPPPGLVDRVYAASVVGLPARAAGAATPIVVVRRRSTMSRLAMAASLGLAFMVAAWVLRSPGLGPALPAVGPTTVSVASTKGSCPLTQEAVLVLADWTEGEQSSVSYLLDTRDITLADVTDELERVSFEYEYLVSNLEEM